MLFGRSDSLDMKFFLQHQAALNHHHFFYDGHNYGVAVLTDCGYRIDASVDRYPLNYNFFTSKGHIQQFVMLMCQCVDANASGFDPATLDRQLLGQKSESFLLNLRTVRVEDSRAPYLDLTMKYCPQRPSGH
jgi:hypothetical protein